MTVRGTAFEAAGSGGSAGVEDAPAAGDIPNIAEFIGQVERCLFLWVQVTSAKTWRSEF